MLLGSLINYLGALKLLLGTLVSPWGGLHRGICIGCLFHTLGPTIFLESVLHYVQGALPSLWGVALLQLGCLFRDI